MHFIYCCFRWKCKDRRYLIKVKGSSDAATPTVNGKCQWSKEYTVVPADLECVIAYCDNPILTPNSDGRNYSFTWNKKVVPVNTVIQYPCMTGMRIQNDTTNKTEASSSSSVKCGADGEFRYPSPWPQCSSTVSCPDPGNSAGVNRTYLVGDSLQYNNVLKYVCTDPRQYIKVAASSAALAAFLTSRCQWRRSFPLDGSGLACTIHHCAHPHSHPGKHQPPPEQNHIELVTPEGWGENNWHVAFGASITYKCEEGKFIETSDPIEIDPTKNQIEVECQTEVGTYETPVVKGSSWPNCTQTVNCGPPPPKPNNGYINAVPGFDGSINWLHGATTDQDTYNTTVEYRCVEGSKFDTTDDGAGDSSSLRTRCQWDKKWAPYSSSLPPCVVTHCVRPFPIPEDTQLEELTATPTAVTHTKNYQCKGKKADGTHTRFWESDRTKSTFEILCKPDGSFDFDNDRSSWPTCIEGFISL